MLLGASIEGHYLTNILFPAAILTSFWLFRMSRKGLNLLYITFWLSVSVGHFLSPTWGWSFLQTLVRWRLVKFLEPFSSQFVSKQTFFYFVWSWRRNRPERLTRTPLHGMFRRLHERPVSGVHSLSLLPSAVRCLHMSHLLIFYTEILYFDGFLYVMTQHF